MKSKTRLGIVLFGLVALAVLAALVLRPDALGPAPETRPAAVTDEASPSATADGRGHPYDNWLANNQAPDGSWDPARHGGARGSNARVEATALAVLSFLIAGQTESVGKYQRVVRSGVDWLVAQQGADGRVGERDFSGDDELRAQAVAGLALSEAWAMDSGARRRETPRRAAPAALALPVAQLGEPAEVRVLAWQALQLRSAKYVALEVPDETFARLKELLARSRRRDGLHRNAQGNLPPESGAAGAAAAIFLGARRDDPAVCAAADYLVRHPPEWGPLEGRSPFEYWYFGTRVCFQAGGVCWGAWKPRVYETLVAHKSLGGETDRSWAPLGHRLGRVGSTALAHFCLEAYYQSHRCLPVYRKQ